MIMKLLCLIDNVFLGVFVKGGLYEVIYVGVLLFMWWCYSCDLDGIDLVVWGILFDVLVFNWFGVWFGL